MIFNEIFYKNRQLPNALLYVRQAGELLKDVNYSISRSDSPTHTIGFLKSGSLKVTSDNSAFTIHSGQSVILPRDIRYTIYAVPTDPPHFLWVNIRGRLIDKISEALFADTPTPSGFFGLDSILKIKELIACKENCSTEITELIFKLLWSIYNNKITPSALNESSSEYELYISNSIQTGFSVSDMASFFHSSTDTLNREFRKKYGTTPYKYYQNMRIEIAKTMLLKSELTVEDIAQRLHFNDRNHFTLCFKRATGEAPIAFKRKYTKHI